MKSAGAEGNSGRLARLEIALERRLGAVARTTVRPAGRRGDAAGNTLGTVPQTRNPKPETRNFETYKNTYARGG